MTSPPGPVVSLFRIALGAYPRDFRLRFGPSMEGAFRDGWSEARVRSRFAALRFLLKTLLNLISTGVAERFVSTRRDTRGSRLGRAVDSLRQDLRFAVRGLLRRPGFTLVVLFTLALGVGANTAMFSVVNGVLLTPLPFEDSDRLVTVWRAYDDAPDTRRNMSEPDVRDIEGAGSFESLVAYSDGSVALTGLGSAEVIEGARTVGGLLEVFDQVPHLGRDLGRADSQEGAAPVVVVSHAFWQDRLGGDVGVLGRTLELDGDVHEIVGVAPPGFDYPDGTRIWRPAILNPTGCGRACHVYLAIGRLAPDVTLEAARLETTAIAHRLREVFTESNHEKLFSLVPLEELIVGDVRTALLVLLASAVLVLLIACANVANLQLVQAQSRTGESALRTALGASGRRLASQMMVESLVLSAIGSTAGLAVAWLGVFALRGLAPPGLPRLDEVAINGSVLLFTLGLIVTVAALFGIAPAIRSARIAPGRSLGGASSRSGGPRTARARSLLLTSEVALSLVLLVGAGLLFKSLAHLSAVPLGYETSNVVRFSLSLPENRYPDLQSIGGFFSRLEERIGAIPGVDAVGSVLGAPLGTTSIGGDIEIVGEPPAEPGEGKSARINTATPGYFETLGLQVSNGRGLLPTDGPGAVPVAVVSQRFVDQYFPGEDPLGEQFTMSISFGFADPTFTIVGVVSDVVSSSLTGPGSAAVYVPIAQMGPGFATVHVRTRDGTGGILDALRTAVQEPDPDLPLWDIEEMDHVVRGELAPTRFYLMLIGLFACLAVTLAAGGLYGVVAYLVSRRTREIGVRVALGANRGSVVGLVLFEAMRPALLGVAVGLFAAWASTRVLGGLLFQVAPTDSVVFVGMALLLLAVVAIAVLLPARHAALIEPTEALQSE